MAKTFRDMIAATSEFQTIAGQPNELPEWNDSYTSILNGKRNFIHEELEELEDALRLTDPRARDIETLDALVDICYFIAGYYSTFGPILRANGHPFPEWNWTAGCNVIADGYRFPEISPGLQGLLDFDSEVRGLLFSTHYTARFYSLPLMRGFDLVHENNMTKPCSSQEEAERTIQSLLPLKCSFSETTLSSGRVVFPVKVDEGQKMAGKLMKSVLYVPVDLSSLF